jgi:transcription antitermination factor NusG
MSEDTLHWYVLRMTHGRELLVRDRLQTLGVEHFIPTQKTRGYRGRTVEKPLVNCLGFVRTTKKDALDLIHLRGVRADYLLDRATHRMMVVPDREMDDFRRVFDLSVEEGDFERPLEPGARVRVVKGPLTGVEGRVLGIDGKWYVAVSLLGVLYARARVPQAWLELVES